MSELISLQGPVEKEGEELVLKIPLEEGGAGLLECSHGIGIVEDECLKIVIPEWLAKHLRIAEGDYVSVNNSNGKFNIGAMSPRYVN